MKYYWNISRKHKMLEIILATKTDDYLPEPTGTIRLITLKIRKGNRKYFGLYFFKAKGRKRQRIHLFLGRLLATAVFLAKTHSTPIVTAQLAGVAVPARMLFEAFILFFRNINFSL
jgi:hypothetical protein